LSLAFIVFVAIYLALVILDWSTKFRYYTTLVVLRICAILTFAVISAFQGNYLIAGVYLLTAVLVEIMRKRLDRSVF